MAAPSRDRRLWRAACLEICGLEPSGHIPGLRLAPGKACLALSGFDLGQVISPFPNSVCSSGAWVPVRSK